MSSEDTVTAPSGRVRRFALRHWVALILAGLAAIFIAQNRDRVDIHVLWISFAAPIWFFFAGLLAVGVLIGLLLRRRRRS
ncbi:LPXTG cell wall anchor domain-containing protein [[Mycobacterium] burgundiense]|jgi:LPXTG-motif cell wall-anchored protein|uniref:LPXTG cell wall anchor domain-containing protein n=1 Tax=[Mycobacterium] burgundiense TaxID=3064286 RepID=A0ABN9N738_9MYCO|nr:LPXTG cell wall anchor domain-containing protein [Mycolicibacterium sp. MU0053]CAJ1501628.1 LPXTG cell wall anchor domain-containing protein [Mycolicibacterium sp. MU0053]